MSEILQNYLEDADNISGGKSWDSLPDDERKIIVEQRIQEILGQPPVEPNKLYFQELLPSLRVRYIVGFDDATAYKNLDTAIDDCFDEHSRLQRELKKCEDVFNNYHGNPLGDLKRGASLEAHGEFYGKNTVNQNIGLVENDWSKLVETAKRYRDIQLDLYKNSVENRCLVRLRQEVDVRSKKE